MRGHIQLTYPLDQAEDLHRKYIINANCLVLSTSPPWYINLRDYVCIILSNYVCLLFTSVCFTSVISLLQKFEFSKR